MPGIPPVLETDSEDVAWALQTADALWARNERVDAIVWLRRAAQAAGDADDHNRALSLARSAAELSERLTVGASTAGSNRPPNVHDSIEELLSVSARPPAMREVAPSAADAHAGMLHPWSDDETKELPQNQVQAVIAAARPTGHPRPVVSVDDDLTETVTAIGAPGSKVAGARSAQQLPPPAPEIFDDDVITSAQGQILRPHQPVSPVPAPVVEVLPVAAPAPAPVAAPVPAPVAAQPPAPAPSPAPPPAAPPPAAKAKPAARSPAKPGIAPSPPKPPPPPRKLGPPPVPAKKPAPPRAPVAAAPPPAIADNQEFLNADDLVSVPPAPTEQALADSQTIHLPNQDAEPGDSVTTRIGRTEAQRFAGMVPDSLVEESSVTTQAMDISQMGVIPEPTAVEESVETVVDVRQDLFDVVRAAEERMAANAAEPVSRPAPAAAVTDHPTSPEVDATTTENPAYSTPRTEQPQYEPPLLSDSDADLSGFAADPSVVAAMSMPPPKLAHEPDVRSTTKDGKEILELDGIEALSDIPDEEREAFAAKATFHELTEGEDIATGALALVISGEVDVVATVLDAAEHLPPGTVLRSRGTNEKGFELRLACRSAKARVATWPSAPVEAAFKSCPWVEDDLRIATDRVQALVGITSGPLSDRLDASLRGEVVRRMQTRALAPNEVLMKGGEPVPGLFLVGVSGIDLVEGDKVKDTVVVGDFLFASQVLGAGPAPATARAPAEGAVVLYCDRKTAQELLVTCPPLLEILAGM